jgi:hypothetical protein
MEKDYQVSYTRYDNKTDGYNDEKGNWVTEFYVVAAKHSNEHETMKVKEMLDMKIKNIRSVKKKVNKAIKYNGDYRGSFMGRTSQGDFTPLFHTLIKIIM